MRIRGLCEFSDGRDWAVGKTRSCSGGQGWAQQNFNPIVCWWVFGLRWPSLGVYRFCGKAKGDLQEVCQDAFSQDFWCQCPCAWGRPLPTNTSAGDPHTLTDRSGSVFCGVTVPFPRVLVCTGFICALQEWSLHFPQSFESSTIKSRWPTKSDSLGILSPFARSPGSGAWCGAKNLHKSTRTSLVLFSPLCGSLTWRVKDFVLSWLLPSYHLTVASPLSLDLGIFSQWVPVPYCLWLFNSYLKFWCSCRRRWMYILLLYNLESTSTPIFLPRKFLGQKSLVGYSQWGCKESDMTEQLIHTTIVIGQFYSEHYIRFCICELLRCRSEVHKPAVLFLPFFSLKQSVN